MTKNLLYFLETTFPSYEGFAIIFTRFSTTCWIEFFFNIKANLVLNPHTKMLPSELFSYLLCVWCSTVSSTSARNSHFFDHMKYSFGRSSYLPDKKICFSPNPIRGELVITSLENVTNWMWETGDSNITHTRHITSVSFLHQDRKWTNFNIIVRFLVLVGQTILCG